jgi:hypothetical protein
MIRRLKFDRAAIVYTYNGPAVFRVDRFDTTPVADQCGGRNAHCLMHGSSSDCEMFCQGLTAAGVVEIRIYTCDRSDDVAEATWRLWFEEDRPSAKWDDKP